LGVGLGLLVAAAGGGVAFFVWRRRRAAAPSSRGFSTFDDGLLQVPSSDGES